MDIREEFEKLTEIRDSLSEHIVFIGNTYTTPSPDFYDLVNWLNGAWYAFQAEIDALKAKIDICEKLRDSQFDKLWNLTQAIEVARNGADEDFDLFLNHLSNILKGE